MRYELSKASGAKPWKVTVTDREGKARSATYADRKAAEKAMREMRAKQKEG